MLLILTSKTDLTADYLICRLLERGVKYFRLNSEDLSTAEYQAYFGNFGTSRRVAVGTLGILIEDVTAVWYRRQVRPLPPDHVIADQQHFAGGELVHLVEGLLPACSIRWVDHPSCVWLGERKLQQLAVAPAMGFNVPETLVSTSADELKAFVERQPQGVVCKPIFRGLHPTKSGVRAAYTRRISNEELVELGTGEIFPTLFQQYIPKGADLRVTVVGDQVFAAEISTPLGVTDWRIPGVQPCYSVVALPRGVAESCRRMLRYFKLHFGAFDLAKAPDGMLFFLEVNPVGEWVWLERECGFRIADSLIDLLVRDAV